MRRTLYLGALRGARGILPAFAGLSPKLRRGLEGRRDAVARLAAWAASQRDPGRPLVWLHAPSVGEALMAGSIAGALRGLLPGVQLALTYFSPSAERLRGRLGEDVFEYLPWDLPGDVATALDALEPTAIAFVRTEIWPELVRAAALRDVPSSLVNAVLTPGSGRLRPAARWLLRPAYSTLVAVGVVSTDDAALFGRLGVPPERLQVTGDARFDQVWARVSASAAGTRRRDAPGPFTLVAGSSWPADEERLVPAFATLAGRASAPRLVVAPHEPTADHIAGLEATLGRVGLSYVRLSTLETKVGAGAGETGGIAGLIAAWPTPAAAVIVDRVGVLADAYGAADAAYVGGGFGRDGLHSTIEPAALGVPVLFGPRVGASREAMELALAGGAVQIDNGADLAAALAELAGSSDVARRRGDAARAFVQSRLGGAQANARLILGTMGT